MKDQSPNPQCNWCGGTGVFRFTAHLPGDRKTEGAWKCVCTLADRVGKAIARSMNPGAEG